MVGQIFNSTTQEAEAADLRDRVQPGLQGKSQHYTEKPAK